MMTLWQDTLVVSESCHASARLDTACHPSATSVCFVWEIESVGIAACSALTGDDSDDCHSNLWDRYAGLAKQGYVEAYVTVPPIFYQDSFWYAGGLQLGVRITTRVALHCML